MEAGQLDDVQFDDDDGIQEIETEPDIVERKPFENMREYAESTMQELLAIYGLAGSELAKSVSRQLPATFLNPQTGLPIHINQNHQSQSQSQQSQQSQQHNQTQSQQQGKSY